MIFHLSFKLIIVHFSMSAVIDNDDDGHVDNDLAMFWHLHNKLLVSSSIVDSVSWGEETHTLREKKSII